MLIRHDQYVEAELIKETFRDQRLQTLQKQKSISLGANKIKLYLFDLEVYSERYQRSKMERFTKINS